MTEKWNRMIVSVATGAGLIGAATALGMGVGATATNQVVQRATWEYGQLIVEIADLSSTLEKGTVEFGARSNDLRVAAWCDWETANKDSHADTNRQNADANTAMLGMYGQLGGTGWENPSSLLTLLGKDGWEMAAYEELWYASILKLEEQEVGVYIRRMVWQFRRRSDL